MGEPLRQIPISRSIVHSVESRRGKRKRFELEAPAQEAEPTKPHGERIGAKKVLVAEARIISHANPICLERRPAPETERVAIDFHGPPERSLEPRVQSLPHVLAPDQQRSRKIQKHHKSEKQSY